MSTAETIKTWLTLCCAVRETVREVGRAPRGVIYATLNARGVSLEVFNQIESALIDAGVVRREGQELVAVQ